jgi:hypothetical protein
MDWVTHDYPALLAANLLRSPTLHGFVFRGKTSQLISQRLGFVPVRLHEKVRMFNAVDDSGLIPGTNKLLFWLRIQHRGMAVEFMKFEDFHNILISTNYDFRQRFQQYHSIWGGIDLMVDPRQVTSV